MGNFDPLAAGIGWRVWGTQANFIGFSDWLRYCTGVPQQGSTKLCTMFGHFWASTLFYTFSGALAPNGIL